MFTKNIINYTKLFRIYLQVVIQSLLANVALFFIGKWLGGFSDSLITPRGQSVNLVSIITPTAVFPLMGLAVFVFILKFSNSPLKWFKILGYGFILIMSGGPLGLENATASDKIILELMHLIVGVQFIEFISRSYSQIVTLPSVVEPRKTTKVSL
jgi:hypothetical protein